MIFIPAETNRQGFSGNNGNLGVGCRIWGYRTAWIKWYGDDQPARVLNVIAKHNKHIDYRVKGRKEVKYV